MRSDAQQPVLFEEWERSRTDEPKDARQRRLARERQRRRRQRRNRVNVAIWSEQEAGPLHSAISGASGLRNHPGPL